MSDKKTEMTKEEWEEALMTTGFMLQTIALCGEIEDMKKAANALTGIPKDMMKEYWGDMEEFKAGLTRVYKLSGLSDLEELGRDIGAIK